MARVNKSSLSWMEPKSYLLRFNINIADPIKNGWMGSDFGKATFDKFKRICWFKE